MHEIIDIDSAGNLLKLKLGFNGSQWGDDWDDIPYEANAGSVYDEYVKDTQSVVYDIDYIVMPYSDYRHLTNTDKSMFDFVERKIPYYYVTKRENPFIIVDEIYLGDKVDKHPLMKLV